MASGPDAQGFSPSGSNAPVDRPVPGSCVDSHQVQRMESPGSAASKTSAESRQAVARGKAMARSSNGSVGSPRFAGNPKKQKVGKPRRVRTGCLTCRERHLKCDEALHRCQNCRKSGRVCQRGVRLNFIDTQTVAPPCCIARPTGTQVTFRDDSRLIASEYVGGFERYPPPEPDHPLGQDPLLGQDGGSSFGFPGSLSDILADSSIFVDDPFTPTFGPSLSETTGVLFDINPPHSTNTSLPGQTAPHTPFGSEKYVSANYCNRVTYTRDPEETSLLRTFVEEVGCWIDTMDPMKHFTQILPFHALEQPLIKTAFMACSARQLHLVNSACEEGDSLYLYDEASQHLLGSLQNPDRDSAMCAAAAVVLNIYELMCSTIMFRMNHSAGARALLKECGWDGKTPGLGGICFWLNVSMELLCCLRFNWTMAWDPDTWGVDMDMDDASSKIVGDEELWIHRIIFICAKVSDFRSSAPHQQTDHPDNNLDLSQRCQHWNKLKGWCDRWQDAVPRSIKPLSNVAAPDNSAFPEVWLVNRPAIIARLFYHTAQILLAKTHPLEPESSPELCHQQQTSARDICGIIAHMSGRGMTNFPIWFFIIGAECLVQRESQAEALRIVDGVLKDNSLRAEYIKNELREAWAWDWDASASHQTAAVEHSVLDSASIFSARSEVLSGIVNPIMATADFSVEGHPYGNYYIRSLSRIDGDAETVGPAWFT